MDLMRLERMERVDAQVLRIVGRHLFVKVQSCPGTIGERFVMLLEDSN